MVAERVCLNRPRAGRLLAHGPKMGQWAVSPARHVQVPSLESCFKVALDTTCTMVLELSAGGPVGPVVVIQSTSKARADRQMYGVLPICPRPYVVEGGLHSGMANGSPLAVASRSSETAQVSVNSL